ncbi:FUSC family protein [Gordonia sp. NB41Y]|uniref:FUSC family protein n=1 Tax=Gordonia sp. NB41Y TaxID=875808 RepID=UPI0006B1CCB6|nr:FUSC family protein [Gordonia sp. NB41Y]WLP89336.1 FUSC family protein [Gordonia sp. NB41Y]
MTADPVPAAEHTPTADPTQLPVRSDPTVHEGFPHRPSVRTILFGVDGARSRIGGALRALIAVALPGLVGLAVGGGVGAAVSTLGAFAVVYGERRLHRVRWQVVCGYGVVLVGCATAGALVGHGMRSWPTALGWIALCALMIAIAVGAAVWVDLLREPAPGSFLLVLCAELAGVLVAHSTASVGAVIGWTAAGAGSALLVTLCAALPDVWRSRTGRADTDSPAITSTPDPERTDTPTVAERLRWGHRSVRTRTLALRLGLACVIAGGAAIAVGLPRPDWAVITAAMILHQGPDRLLGSWRGVHRLVGTVLGVLVLAALAVPLQIPAVLIIAVAVLMAVTEVFLVVNYSIAMIVITPLAMILGELAPPASLGPTLFARILETVVGVTVAVTVLWVVLPRAHRSILADANARVAASITDAATEPDSLPHHRRLDHALRTGAAALRHAAHCEPEWARRRWPAHHGLHTSGRELLADRERAATAAPMPAPPIRPRPGAPQDGSEAGPTG